SRSAGTSNRPRATRWCSVSPSSNSMTRSGTGEVPTWGRGECRCRAPRLLLGSQSHDRRALQYVDRSIRSLPDLTDPLLLLREQLFFGCYAFAAQHEAHQVLASHRADEQV